jgi:Xaa-Pro aminopeptidase
MVKPGTRCEDIDLATQEYFRSQGFGDAIRHRTGHGIGLGNHEAPWLSAGGNHDSLSRGSGQPDRKNIPYL